MTTGDVEINILDGGSSVVVVPAANVQVVIGTCSSGTAAQVVATRDPNTLTSVCGYGPGVEVASAVCKAGGTVLFMKAASATAGLVRGSDASPLAISAVTNASPAVVTTPAHNLITGKLVTIAGVGGAVGANGTFKITVLSPTTFSLDGSTAGGVYTSGGTAQPLGTAQIGTGTSLITLTGTPNDDYYLKVLIVNGGTTGVTGITFQVSFDAGRNYGPVLALGAGITYLLTNTGLTLNFVTAKTLVKGDLFYAGCIAPQWNTAGIQACLVALQASAYAITGWGDGQIVGPMTGADTSTIQGYVNTMALGYIFTRFLSHARDASPPVLYGGTAETESTWMTAVQADYAAVDAKRMCANAGFYNMPTALPNPLAGSPRYRRPLSLALGARQVIIPPQRHAGRVRDGALSNIVIDPTNDPTDGFIYHDERLNPGMDGARFTSARTRIKKPGYYIVNPNLMSALGSVFTLLPLGNVMDVACTIAHEVGQDTINADLRLNPNGTLYELEAKSLEGVMTTALTIQMVNTAEVSAVLVTVSRSQNVLATKKVKMTITIAARGYVLEEDIDIGFADATLAA